MKSLLGILSEQIWRKKREVANNTILITYNMKHIAIQTPEADTSLSVSVVEDSKIFFNITRD